MLRMLLRCLPLLSLLGALLAPLPARAGPYDPQRAGHPLRIVAYVLHPVGYALDRLIFHPVWWVGQHEPFRSVFGVQGDPTERPGD